MYTKSGSVCKEYNFISKRWMQKKIRPLTQSEREILILAQQDKNTQEMADSLYKSKNTIRNQIKSLFTELNVHSMPEILEYANNHRLIYPDNE